LSSPSWRTIDLASDHIFRLPQHHSLNSAVAGLDGRRSEALILASRRRLQNRK
jgi:hypothetical protein